jgi:hypothetical protein
MKTCRQCNLVKPLKDFYNEPRVKDGKQARCKACHGKTTEKYRKKNPEIYRKASLKNWHSLDAEKRQARWIKRYGITANDYKQLLEKQASVCKICQKPCSSRQFLSVDHCHKTGKVRGLLCVKCNTALGMLDDNIQHFETAIKYLKSFEEKL